MEAIITAISPLLVTLITAWVKKLPGVPMTGFRKSALRIIVAVLSYAAVLGAAMMNGQTVDPVATETFVQAFLVFLGSSGAYLISKK